VVHCAIVDGALEFVVRREGRLFSVGGATIRDGRVVELAFVADPERVERLARRVLEG
jgi:hypothetical protein